VLENWTTRWIEDYRRADWVEHPGTDLWDHQTVITRNPEAEKAVFS
jgi:hypothetical protein